MGGLELSGSQQSSVFGALLVESGIHVPDQLGEQIAEVDLAQVLLFVLDCCSPLEFQLLAETLVLLQEVLQGRLLGWRLLGKLVSFGRRLCVS